MSRGRDRRAFTVLEIVFVALILALCFGYALQTLWYNRRAGEGTSRVEDLGEIRRLITQVQRDLQEAVVIERPGWAASSTDVVYLDGEHRTVSFWLEDESGARVEGDPPPQGPVLHLVRALWKAPDQMDKTRVDRGLKLGGVRFFRLGRSMVGVRIVLRGDPDAAIEPLRRPSEFSTVITLPRLIQ